MKKDEDRKFLLSSPDGKKFFRVTRDGISVMEPADIGTDNAVSVQTRRISGSLHEITSETPVAGPSMVNSEEYRAGWERIFGAKREVGQA